MFGKLRSILDEVPNYVVDYQERPEPKAELRWVDRLTTDGMWSGNLYDFYRLVIRKLGTDVKVPFKLRGDQRQDDTPVHEALREALVNTLIHGDYSGRISVLVVKRPDMFGFRNPGTMRVPIGVALQGGESDCRNRNLQKMFQLVGLGEQAGSGLPKIYRNWEGQSWRKPLLYEKYEREQTLLELRMVSLLPEEVMHELDRRFGERFRCLPEVERLALATVAIEGSVTHSRLKDITTTHPHDLTRALSGLVRDGFLESAGTGRGTFYVLPGERSLSVEDPFSSGVVDEAPGWASHDALEEKSEHCDVSSEQYTTRSEHLGPSSEHFAQLMVMSAGIRLTKRAPKERVGSAILKACEDVALSLRELSELLGREAVTVRTHYIAHLVAEERLKLLYPDKPNHPRQRYRTTQKGSLTLSGSKVESNEQS